MRLLLYSLAIVALSPIEAAPPPSPVESVKPAAGRPHTPSAMPTADRNLYTRAEGGISGEASQNPRAYARRLFSRLPERIVDVEERHSGPGLFLVGVTLYERPEAHHLAGLCQVRVHEVSVNTAPPPQDPPRYAETVRTSTRYFAIGPVSSSIPPSDQRQRCASLPSARNFFTASEGDAHLALQALSEARHFVTNMPRAISFTCTSYRGQCAEPAQLFMNHMRPDRVRSVERIPCADGNSDIDNPCFRIGFGSLPEIGGDWTLTSQGLRRPMRLQLEQAHPPVS